MSRFRRCLPGVAACVFVVAGLAVYAQTAPDAPNVAGIFFSTSSGWQRLFETTTDGMTPTGCYFEPCGSHTDFRTIYNGPRSPVQLSERRPTFYVNLGWRPDRHVQQIQVVRLRVRKGYREMRYWWDIDSMRFGLADSTPVVGEYTPGGVLTVRPVTALEPGQYVLSLGPIAQTYDFEIQ
jgi:hypothetical protein